MANIRIKLLPSDSAPSASDVMALDGSTTRQGTVKDIVYAGRPTATQGDAVAGIDNDKVMTALTVKQSIGANTATVEQGEKADTALQPGDPIPDNSMPVRLGANASFMTDANNAVTAGWYRLNTTSANSPDAASFFVVRVESYNANNIIQTARESSGDREFERRYNNGTWQSWQQKLTRENDLDARYAHQDTFSTFFMIWFATLPTSEPPTPGPWNNGNTLAIKS